MNHYILEYQLHQDYLRLREDHRLDHFNLIKRFKASGELLMGGATTNHIEAYLIFKCASEDRVEDFVKHDPYVTNHVVTDWVIKPWNMVTEDI